MTTRIPLRCRCGTVRGSLVDVTPGDRARAVCYCDDCQIYALHLGREDLLDERGGTEAVMSTPAQVTYTHGADQLRCVRLSPKGLFRWYAGCCNTPLGNTLGPRIPVLILPTVSLDLETLGQSTDDVVGATSARIHGRFAKGGLPAGAHPKLPASLLPRFVARLTRALWKGRAQPSPFFDAHGVPRIAPRMIDKAERESIRGRVLAAAGG